MGASLPGRWRIEAFVGRAIARFDGGVCDWRRCRRGMGLARYALTGRTAAVSATRSSRSWTISSGTEIGRLRGTVEKARSAATEGLRSLNDVTGGAQLGR